MRNPSQLVAYSRYPAVACYTLLQLLQNRISSSSGSFQLISQQQDDGLMGIEACLLHQCARTHGDVQPWHAPSLHAQVSPDSGKASDHETESSNGTSEAPQERGPEADSGRLPGFNVESGAAGSYIKAQRAWTGALACPLAMAAALCTSPCEPRLPSPPRHTAGMKSTRAPLPFPR